MTNLTSSDLYKLLQDTFAEAEAQIKDSLADPDLRIGFTLYAGEVFDSKRRVEFRICSSYPNEAKAEGYDFWEVVGEFIHCRSFNQRQQALAIGYQTIENGEKSA